MLYTEAMGFFRDRLAAEYEGVQIQVETDITHLLPPQVRTRVLVAGQPAGEVSFFQGQVFLPGVFFMGDKKHEVKLRIRHGLLGTDYKLEIDGREHPIQRLV